MEKHETPPVEVVPISEPEAHPKRQNYDPSSGLTKSSSDPGKKRRTRRRKQIRTTCKSCGETRTITWESKGEPPALCRTCSSKVRRRRKRTGTTIPCGTCGVPVYRHPGNTEKRYCSQACAGVGKRRYEKETRACWTCGSEFQYTPRPFSNNSGHYCSRDCRNAGYIGVVNGDPAQVAKTDRHGWRSRRDAFVQEGNDFCAVCGKRSGRLHVHHIEGYRNVHHDDLSTVVTLCPKHHKLLERWTRLIKGLEPARRRHAAIGILGCLGDSWAYHSGKALAEGRAS
jgi:hypothetical protein